MSWRDLLVGGVTGMNINSVLEEFGGAIIDAL
jgi:hypothetical protein